MHSRLKCEQHTSAIRETSDRILKMVAAFDCANNNIHATRISASSIYVADASKPVLEQNAHIHSWQTAKRVFCANNVCVHSVTQRLPFLDTHRHHLTYTKNKQQYINIYIYTLSGFEEAPIYQSYHKD